MIRVQFGLVTSLAAILILSGTTHAEAEHHFQLGFKSLADQIPGIVGEPLEDEHYNPANGDSLQQTTTGLMVWQKADNWTAFTDGAHTWVNGPQGIQERGNQERFPWEAPTPNLALMQAPTQDAGFSATAEQTALGLINQSRAQNGVPPVAMDEALRQIARSRARDMSVRGYFSHITPEGLSVFDLLRAAGISFEVAAENIGYGVSYGSPIDVVRADHGTMMAETPPEDGHRKNILDGSLHKVGIGVYTGKDGKSYYVCDFTD